MHAKIRGAFTNPPLRNNAKCAHSPLLGQKYFGALPQKSSLALRRACPVALRQVALRHRRAAQGAATPQVQ